MPEPVKYRAKEEELVVPVKPVVTAMLLILCFMSFADLQGHGMLWLKNHAFSGGKFAYQISHGAFPKMIEMMWAATFINVNLFHLAGNCYFLWVFGSTVESRVGNLRFMAIVLILIFGGWFILGQAIGTKSPLLYVSPAILTAGIIGAYMCFFPEKKMNPAGHLKYTYRIFKDDPTPNPADAFGVSPWFVLVAFIAFEVAMSFILAKNPIVALGNINPVAGFWACVLGAGAGAATILVSTMGTKGHPLARLAVKRYRELRKLDMTHDEALRAVSRLMSVPLEQVKQWVAQGSGQLP